MVESMHSETGASAAVEAMAENAPGMGDVGPGATTGAQAIPTGPVSVPFVLAGKATFTVSNGKGERYTYRVTHKAAGPAYGEAWFVSLLTGQDNTNDYSYLGMLDKATLTVKLTKGSKVTADSKAYRVVAWALKVIKSGKALPQGYAILHSGHCGRCGKLLTVPESILRGLGPECAGKTV